MPLPINQHMSWPGRHRKWLTFFGLLEQSERKVSSFAVSGVSLIDLSFNVLLFLEKEVLLNIAPATKECPLACVDSN